MKKNFIMTIVFFIAFFCIPLYAYADYDAIITGNTVRIRSGAGTNNGALYTVNSGTEIKVVDKTLYSGTGCSDKWYKVIYKNKTGYVCSTYVRFMDNSFAGINVADWTARVSGNNVACRGGAGTKYTKQDTLSLGVNVKILGSQNTSNSGCSTEKWFKIEYYNGKVGYICSKYVVEKKNVTKNDEEYAKTLKAAGFTDSYIPYLTYLHNKYPNWTFIAKNTGSSFAVAVSSEEGKNYMQTTNDNYRTSSTPAEGSSWFKVNTGVIAFYMDPRNWLTEERIFMFEKLDYTSEFDNKYPGMIKAIFGSGKLADDKYTVPMFNAGKTNKISPVHIASRIKQEVGANGSDSTNGTEFTFKGKKYSGYYNFFNIGAYEQTIDGVHYNAITRGLAYAAKLISRSGEVWDNIQTAITEGSAFLANGYINRGQGTLYYQKFNVSPDAYYSNYTHQYMTNIQAPATEGNSTYNSYKSSGILNEPLIFEIPVYSYMPLYTSLPASGDSNNYLKSLSIDNYSISPDFDTDVLTYEVYVPSNTKEVNVKAEAESSKATVSGAGKITLNQEDTDITITVTSETKEVRRYIITVKKDGNTNSGNDNNNTTTNDNNNTSNNNQNTNNNSNTDNNQNTNNDNNDNTSNNNDNNSNNTTNNDSTNTTNDVSLSTILNKASISVSGNNVTNIKYNTSVSSIHNKLINAGALSATFKNTSGTSINGNTLITTGSSLTINASNESKTYTFVIHGDTSGDGNITILDLLQVQKHIKGDKKLNSSFLNAGDTSGDGQVTILDLLQVQKHIKGDKRL